MSLLGENRSYAACAAPLSALAPTGACSQCKVRQNNCLGLSVADELRRRSVRSPKEESPAAWTPDCGGGIMQQGTGISQCSPGSRPYSPGRRAAEAIGCAALRPGLGHRGVVQARHQLHLRLAPCQVDIHHLGQVPLVLLRPHPHPGPLVCMTPGTLGTPFHSCASICT